MIAGRGTIKIDQCDDHPRSSPALSNAPRSMYACRVYYSRLDVRHSKVYNPLFESETLEKSLLTASKVQPDRRIALAPLALTNLNAQIGDELDISFDPEIGVISPSKRAEQWDDHWGLLFNYKEKQ